MVAKDIFNNEDVGIYWSNLSPDEFSVILESQVGYLSIDEAYTLATNLLKKIELLRKVG